MEMSDFVVEGGGSLGLPTNEPVPLITSTQSSKKVKGAGLPSSLM